MSTRVALKPIPVPSGVQVTLNGQNIAVKGSKGDMQYKIHDDVEIAHENDVIKLKPRINAKSALALTGTMRALVNNIVIGVTTGFERKLTLIGVGYRAQVQGQKINLTLGFSHPVVYELPQSVKAEMPSQTEIVLKSSDKQVLGQVAAEIRSIRSPDPYKGKGVRYADEQISLKETKKK